MGGVGGWVEGFVLRGGCFVRKFVRAVEVATTMTTSSCTCSRCCLQLLQDLAFSGGTRV